MIFLCKGILFLILVEVCWFHKILEFGGTLRDSTSVSCPKVSGQMLGEDFGGKQVLQPLLVQ